MQVYGMTHFYYREYYYYYCDASTTSFMQINAGSSWKCQGRYEKEKERKKERVVERAAEQQLTHSLNIFTL